MGKKTYFKYHIHLMIYLISSILFAYYLDVSMLDDGLRHISFANNIEIMHNWGEVFPNSLFGSYDPWYLWHKFLQIAIEISSYEKVHILINSIVLFLLLLLVDVHFRDKIKYDYASLTYIIVLSIVYLSCHRYIMVRPDLLSGLYVIFMLTQKNRFILPLFITLFYGPFYYLFFIYTGSIGLTYIIQRDWRSLFGTFLGSIIVLIIYLFTDKNGYIQTIINILNDQNLRMGLEVSEGTPLFSIFDNLSYYILLPLFLICSFCVIYWKYEYFRKNSVATFLVITSILWVNQIRYYILFLPLIVLFLTILILNLDKKLFFYRVRKILFFIKKYVSYSKKVKIFYIIAIPYTIFALSYAFIGKSKNESLEKGRFYSQKEFSNKTILFNSLHIDIYKALYFNPTIKTVPSCSIGWFDDKNKKMKDIYIRMQKDDGISENELRELIDYVDADIYIHYLRNNNQILNFEKLKKLGILPLKIYKNRIIFEIEKKDE